MTLVKWNPRHSLITDFDRMIDGFFNNDWNLNTRALTNWSPAVDIKEQDDKFLITADIPGLTKKDVKLIVRDGVLSITGERNDKSEKETGSYHYRERRNGSFSRSFRLPETVNEEKISAKFANGILSVILPKFEEVLPKEQEIKIS